MDTRHEAQLIALLTLWIEARPFGLPSMTVAGGTRNIPPSLLSTITVVEPYRGQVLHDAHYFLSFPKPVGLGLTCEISEPGIAAPFEGWHVSISPVRVKLLWSDTFSDANFTGFAYETFQRVALEDDQWKVVRLWDAETLQAYLRSMEQFAQFLKQQRARN